LEASRWLAARSLSVRPFQSIVRAEMAKKQSPSLVSPETAGLLPPRPLGPHGMALWDRVQREYRVADTGGAEILAQACSALDRAESLAEAIERDGPVILTRTGVPKAHPACKDELACRAFIVRSLGSASTSRPLGPVLADRRPASVGPGHAHERDPSNTHQPGVSAAAHQPACPGTVRRNGARHQCSPAGRRVLGQHLQRVLHHRLPRVPEMVRPTRRIAHRAASLALAMAVPPPQPLPAGISGGGRLATG
jgi:hypothetical protein